MSTQPDDERPDSNDRGPLRSNLDRSNLNSRQMDPARTVVLMVVFQVLMLIAVVLTAVVGFLEVASYCGDLFTGNVEMRGEGAAEYRIVPGDVEVLCRTPTGVLSVPMNGAAASIFFAGVGLLLTLVFAVAYGESRRRTRK